MYTPNFVAHPGEYLLAELEERKISQRQFAKFIQKTHSEVNDIILGKKNINADFAMRFSSFFGTTPELWLNLQNAYDLFVVAQTPSKENLFLEISAAGKQQMA